MNSATRFLRVELRHRYEDNEQNGERFQTEAKVVRTGRKEDESDAVTQNDEAQLERAAHCSAGREDISCAAFEEFSTRATHRRNRCPP